MDIKDSVSVNGGIFLGEGSDHVFVREGAEINSMLDGGTVRGAALTDHWDKLFFTDFEGEFDVAQLRNWENVVLENSSLSLNYSGSSLFRVGRKDGMGVFVDGQSSLSLDSIYLTGNMQIDEGGVIFVHGNTAIYGDLRNDGLISLVDQAADDSVFVADSSTTGSGHFALDVDLSSNTSDLIKLEGALGGFISNYNIAFNFVGGPANGEDILFAQGVALADSGAFAGIFRFGTDNTVELGKYVYSVAHSSSELGGEMFNNQWWLVASEEQGPTANIYQGSPTFLALELPTFKQRTEKSSFSSIRQGSLLSVSEDQS